MGEGILDEVVNYLFWMLRVLWGWVFLELYFYGFV